MTAEIQLIQESRWTIHPGGSLPAKANSVADIAEVITIFN